MLKRVIPLLLSLLLMIPAFAEAVPTLPGQFLLTGLPENMSFQVYTGPGLEYHQAARGRAKVSTNGPIQCYGRIGDTGWVLVRYEVSAAQVRVGCIDLSDYPDAWRGRRELPFAGEPLLLAGEVEITDDPYRSGKVLGTVSGRVTLLAWRGNEWAYVEGVLNAVGGPLVRGFIPRTALNGAVAPPDLPVSIYAGERYVLDAEYRLNLPGDALADGMNVYPLVDGSYLISYRCSGDDRLYLRVISAEGKKLWAKSVDHRYLYQITLTRNGFICETFDNSECDSGMRYTYVCKGRKWAAKSVRWIAEPDRTYADNTAGFTILRHTFGEGGQPMPFEVTNRRTGEVLQSETYTFKPFLYEMDGSLLLLDEAADGTLALRIFSADLADVTCAAAPAALADRWNIIVRTADHSRNAVYFFTHEGDDWRMWRFDRETLTFADEPIAIPVPQPCTLVALGAGASGTHTILMKTDFGAYLCELRADGTLCLHQSLPGNVVWMAPGGSGYMLILQNSEGDFILRHYMVIEG